MIIKTIDYNNAGELINSTYHNEWQRISTTLNQMPLYLKASDQEGKKGKPIFDPVGTNQHIKGDLVSNGWESNIPIPDNFDFLGTDIDFGKRGMIVEVQFSNYPFLLNNTVRSELFYKSGWVVDGMKVKMALIITKAHMFPSSNSTLYFEQARNQLDELSKHGVFNIPVRLVGLFESYDIPINAIHTTYSETRYSRSVVAQNQITCTLEDRSSRKKARRCSIDID